MKFLFNFYAIFTSHAIHKHIPDVSVSHALASVLLHIISCLFLTDKLSKYLLDSHLSGNGFGTNSWLNVSGTNLIYCFVGTISSPQRGSWCTNYKAGSPELWV